MVNMLMRVNELQNGPEPWDKLFVLGVPAQARTYISLFATITDKKRAWLVKLFLDTQSLLHLSTLDMYGIVSIATFKKEEGSFALGIGFSKYICFRIFFLHNL